MKRILVLVMAAAVMLLASGCTPNQVNAWKKWYRTDPVAAKAFLKTDTFQELNRAADGGDAPAKRGEAVQVTSTQPPPPDDDDGGSSSSSNGRCVGYEGLLARYSPGWNVQTMSRIMYRESRCNPGAYNRSGATGLLQVLQSHCGWLAPRIGGCNLTNPSYNIRAAAELYRNGGSAHWAMTR